MKRNKEPSQESIESARRINLYLSKDKKFVWVPCIVCGDLCPQQLEGPYANYDEVHITCTREPEYPKRVKELQKRRQEVEKPFLLF
jgi:hypothetical protein